MSISHQLVQFGFIVFDTNSSMQTVGMPSSPVAFLARCLPRQLPSSPVAFLYLALPQIIFSLVSTNQDILHLVFATLSASPVSKPCASVYLSLLLFASISHALFHGLILTTLAVLLTSYSRRLHVFLFVCLHHSLSWTYFSCQGSSV